METYDLEQGDENHGYNGPLHVSRGGSTSDLGEQFINVAKSLYGWDYMVDAQDFKTIIKLLDGRN